MKKVEKNKNKTKTKHTLFHHPHSQFCQQLMDHLDSLLLHRQKPCCDQVEILQQQLQWQQQLSATTTEPWNEPWIDVFHLVAWSASLATTKHSGALMQKSGGAVGRLLTTPCVSPHLPTPLFATLSKASFCFLRCPTTTTTTVEKRQEKNYQPRTTALESRESRGANGSRRMIGRNGPRSPSGLRTGFPVEFPLSWSQNKARGCDDPNC